MRIRKARRFPKRKGTFRNLNYYAALEPQQSDSEPVHPLDDILDDLPHLRRKLAHLRRCEAIVQPLVAKRQAFVNYADAQTDYRHARQISAFNIGVELGVIVGRTQPSKASKAGPPPLHGAILGAALSGTHAPAGRLLSLLAIADALMSGQADVRALQQAIDKFKMRRRRREKARRHLR